MLFSVCKIEHRSFCERQYLTAAEVQIISYNISLSPYAFYLDKIELLSVSYLIRKTICTMPSWPMPSKVLSK